MRYSCYFTALFLHCLIHVDANGGGGTIHYAGECVQLQTYRQEILHWFYTVMLWYVQPWGLNCYVP